MRVAIHQPNFVPWYPFFQKMEASDAFVLIDRCQFEKGKFQNRFRLNEEWFTMSVNHGLDPIIDKRYVNAQQDWSRIKQRLPQFLPILSQMDSQLTENLSSTNHGIILILMEMLGINRQVAIHTRSDLTGTERLVDICKWMGADTYLSGPSGWNYLDQDKFDQAGIKIEYQDMSKIDRRHSLEVIYERCTALR